MIISIILPAFNSEKYIRKSVDSCLNQTYRNIELIIVDDGSKDKTFDVINSYQDDRIKYIKHNKNLGIANALNKGFSMSTGEYLTWTSDDNYYAKDAIAQLENILRQNKRIDFIYSNYYSIDEEDNIIKVCEVKDVDRLVSENCIGPCFLFRRKVYEVTGNFRNEAFLAEDYDYWIRVSKNFTMSRYPRELYYYRIHSSSLTSRYGVNKIQSKTEQIKNIHFVAAKDYYARAISAKKLGFGRKAFFLAIRSLWKMPFSLKPWILLLKIVAEKVRGKGSSK